MNGISKRKDGFLLNPVLRVNMEFPAFKRPILKKILRRIKTKNIVQHPGHECWNNFHNGKVKKCLVDATLYQRCLDSVVADPPKEPMESIKVFEALRLAREGTHFKYVNPFLAQVGAGSTFQFSDRGLFGAKK